MFIPSVLIDFIIIFLGIFLALFAIYAILKKDIQGLISTKQYESNKEIRSHLLPLRLQAHERLIIFIDRIDPSNMMLRLHHQGIGILELQAAVLNEVRSEYQHNITQQLYVDPATWQVIKKLKDDTIAMVNNGVQGLGTEATGKDLSKTILEHMAGIEDNPYDLTIGLIKIEIQRLF